MLRRNFLALPSLLLAECIALGLPWRIAAAEPASAPGTRRAAMPNAGELINESGRLRYLAERMGKAYAQQALKILPEKAVEQIRQSQQRYVDALQFLGNGARSPDLKSGLAVVTAIYGRYIVALGKPANAASVAAAHRITDELVAAADKLTTVFQMQTNIQSAKIVNLSGRQRMLSQHMARLYFGALLSNTRADLDQVRQQFKSAMTTLEKEPLSTEAIKRELALAKNQWLFLEQALNGGSAPNVAARNVATTSERLLETMDNLTDMYSLALKAALGRSADFVQRA